jgi:hypothetical protein
LQDPTNIWNVPLYVKYADDKNVMSDWGAVKREMKRVAQMQFKMEAHAFVRIVYNLKVIFFAGYLLIELAHCN